MRSVLLLSLMFFALPAHADTYQMIDGSLGVIATVNFDAVTPHPFTINLPGFDPIPMNGFTFTEYPLTMPNIFSIGVYPGFEFRLEELEGVPPRSNGEISKDPLSLGATEGVAVENLLDSQGAEFVQFVDTPESGTGAILLFGIMFAFLVWAARTFKSV